MFEVQIFIPLQDNEAREFTSGYHQQFERAILERFGGLSLLPGTVAGQWLDQNTVFFDTLRVYAVALESLTQGGLVGELVEIAKAHYRQEAVFIRYLGQAEIL
ncbi:MAG: hypothetical protein V3S29_05170 [bacterium]